MAEELLQGRIAAQGWNTAHHDQLVLGSGDGNIQAAPVLQQGAKLEKKCHLLLFFLLNGHKPLIFKKHLNY